MNNPNKLTGETVLEKLKYWQIEADNLLINKSKQTFHSSSRGGFIELDGQKFNDDMKWCIDFIEQVQNDLDAADIGG